ncbi:YybS family protein [Neobacillus soli]|uniref:YybS family protein n=1 Tax=Neobacillus soli TaxID=220688 RepID=UPI00082636EF|nr:YybS family protein [Neobacillus soli]
MKNVNKLTEGAILLAVLAALIFITIYVPVIGSILNLALPLPFIMFAAKNNVKNISAFFLAGIFISFIAGSFIGIGLMLIYGAAGVVIGYLLQKNKSRTAIFISSSLTYMAGFVIFYIVVVAFLKMDIIHEFTLMLNESFKSSQVLLKAMGNEEQLKQLQAQNAALIKTIETLAPSALIMASFFATFLTQWICFPIAKRFGVKVEPWGNIRNMILPRSLLWYYLIVIVANMLFHPQEGTYIYTALINLKSILEMFLIVQGLSFLFYIFHQRSVSKGLRAFIVILAFIIPIFRTIILILGITDMGFEFRKRIEKKE